MSRLLKRKTMKKITAVLALFSLGFCGAALAEEEELPLSASELVDYDPMGIWTHSRGYGYAKDEGSQTVLFPKENNFFVYYVPPDYKSGRVMVAVHGAGSNPYDELMAEIPMAKQFDYLAVAVNWGKPGSGVMNADALYRNIQMALAYLQKKESNSLEKVAYIGFSRAAAVSYEIAYLDAHKWHLFDLFIAHSGGIPADYRVEPKRAGAEPDAFLVKLVQGRLGPAPLKETAFFLYSGDKDEDWGLRMSEQVENAEKLITQNGGTVVERVRRTDLGHAGLRSDPSINEKAVRAFIERTP